MGKTIEEIATEVATDWHREGKTRDADVRLAIEAIRAYRREQGEEAAVETRMATRVLTAHKHTLEQFPSVRASFTRGAVEAVKEYANSLTSRPLVGEVRTWEVGVPAYEQEGRVFGPYVQFWAEVGFIPDPNRLDREKE